MIYTTDDLCPSNLKYFKYWDKAKELKPDLKLIAFTIADYQGKEDVSESKEFIDWFEDHRGWVELGVHSLEHTYPPDAERDDFSEVLGKALEILKPFLPDKYMYRSPGFQSTVRMPAILRYYGFTYQAYEDRIRNLNTNRLCGPVFNSHCSNKYSSPITRVWRNIS